MSRRNAINLSIFGTVSVRITFQIQSREIVHRSNRIQKGDTPDHIHNLRNMEKAHVGLRKCIPLWIYLHSFHKKEIQVLQESNRGFEKKNVMKLC